jgi:predicted ATPase
LDKGHVRKVFPGANTGRGFLSFFDYVIPEDARRIFVIKGGPGVGKSTFMRKIAEKITELGYDVEYHCCAADPDSLDGVVIPAFDIGLLDGTAPQSAVTDEELRPLEDVRR